MGSVSQEHIEIVEGARGPKARIRGHNIRVIDVVHWHEKQGLSAEQIVKDFPQLTMGDVYGALAYYWDHQDEIDRRMAEDDAFVEEFRRQHPGRLQDKLRQLQSG